MGSSGGGDGGAGMMALMQQGTPMPGLPVAGKDNVTGDPFTYGQFQNFLPDIKEGEKNPTATGLTPDMFNYTKPSQPRDQLAQAMAGGGGGGGGAAAGGGGSSDNPYGVAANIWAQMSPGDKMTFNSTMAAQGGGGGAGAGAGAGAGGLAGLGGGGAGAGPGAGAGAGAGADDTWGANILGARDWNTFKGLVGPDAAGSWLRQYYGGPQQQGPLSPYQQIQGYGGVGANVGNASAAAGNIGQSSGFAGPAPGDASWGGQAPGPTGDPGSPGTGSPGGDDD